MRFNILLTLLLTMIANGLVGQNLNRIGNPFITNFTPETYNGSEQTWCIAQDDRGIMYFGTQDDGIIEYDGYNWRKINIPENKPVLSMAKGENGTIYVGSSGELGYLEPSLNGNLEFVSLSSLIPDSIKQKFTLFFYKTYYYKGETYFCTPVYIFKYDGVNLKPIYLGDRKELGNFLTFIVNNTIYIGSFLKGLFILNDNNNLDIAPGAQNFVNKDIYGILNLNDKELLVVTGAGFYKYNPTSGETSPFDDSKKMLSKFFDQSMIPYCAILSKKNVGVGYVQTEWVSYQEIQPNAETKYILNNQNGLHASHVTYLYQKDEQPLWLTFFDGGIAKAEVNSSVNRFGKESGIDQLILDIVRFNGILYIASMNGVYYLDQNINGIPYFKAVENISGQVNDLMIFTPSKGTPILIAGTYFDGIYEIRNNKAISISEPLKKTHPDVQHNAWCLYQSKTQKDIVYIGKNHGLSSLSWKNGRWVKTENHFKDELITEIRSIGEDNRGNLWLSTWYKGFFVVNEKNKLINLSSLKYEFQKLKQVYIYSNNDSLYFITPIGIYNYNYEDSTFLKSKFLESFENNKGVFKISETSRGYAFLCYDEEKGTYWTELIEKDSKGTWSVNKTPFKRLPNKWSEAIYVDKDGIIWIGMANELYSYNPKVKRDYDVPYRTLIRKVVAKDSLLFDGTYYTINDNGKRVASIDQHASQVPRLTFRHNGVVVNYSSPFYEKETDILFSHYLEGSDETTWGKWDSRTETTYTNLREGKYTFHVKAKNIYGVESLEASYSFEIRPPWYRTILAYILYLCSLILLIWGIVKWNTRRLIAEKEHLEQIVKERTAEVVAQKEEIEVQNEKIAAQNEEIKSSIQYASRIQGAILTPPDQVNRIFPDNFILYLPRDIVSGDFYYITQVGNKRISVVADCTGHGVPGGFMSMLGVSFLTQIISQTEDLSAATILNKLRQQVITALHQTGEIGGSKDGMDIALYIFDEQTMKLQFAGANNPLIHISNGELNHIKSDKMPIGIHIRGDIPFTNFEIDVKKGDVIYTFSDGYADQFGGGDARKFMIKNLKDLLLEIHQKPMDEQRDILDKTLLNWHGDTPRIDDVVVMGMRV